MVALLVTLATPAQEPIVGPATVIDGATVVVRGTRIRLWGIHAPKAGEICDRKGEPYPLR